LRLRNLVLSVWVSPMGLSYSVAELMLFTGLANVGRLSLVGSVGGWAHY
jgi:hypothetical protein